MHVQAQFIKDNSALIKTGSAARWGWISLAEGEGNIIFIFSVVSTTVKLAFGPYQISKKVTCNHPRIFIPEKHFFGLPIQNGSAKILDVYFYTSLTINVAPKKFCFGLFRLVPEKCKSKFVFGMG